MTHYLLRLVLLPLICLLTGLYHSAIGEECRIGFSWVISHSPTWGTGLPIVTKVIPHSPAESAGLRTGAIIEQIDGLATHTLTARQIEQLLHSSGQVHTLQTRYLGGRTQQHILTYDCRPRSGITERQLAELFSLYSTEDVSFEVIDYPYTFQTKGSPRQLQEVRTFAFAPSPAETVSIDKKINEMLLSQLTAKGLSYSTTQPDLIISTSYDISANNTETVDNDETTAFSWRYNPQTGYLNLLPLYTPQYALSKHTQAKYRLSFAVSMQSSMGNKEILWSCEARELLSQPMSITEYASHAIGTMLLGFPYTEQTDHPQVAVQTLRYNYTGIIYATDKMNRIAAIEEESPAMRAGLAVDDIILSIDGIQMNSGTSDEVLDNYFDAIQQLEPYRDTTLPPLESLLGNKATHYWRTDSYPEIAATLKQRKYHNAFIYLFAFRPYISEDPDHSITMQVLRRGEVYSLTLRPVYRQESCAYML